VGEVIAKGEEVEADVETAETATTRQLRHRLLEMFNQPKYILPCKKKVGVENIHSLIDIGAALLHHNFCKLLTYRRPYYCILFR